MALSEKQAKALRAKLRHQYVKVRESAGTTIAYVEGWHVISEANRNFGFENWDRQTQTAHLFERTTGNALRAPERIAMAE